MPVSWARFLTPNAITMAIDTTRSAPAWWTRAWYRHFGVVLNSSFFHETVRVSSSFIIELMMFSVTGGFLVFPQNSIRPCEALVACCLSPSELLEAMIVKKTLIACMLHEMTKMFSNYSQNASTFGGRSPPDLLPGLRPWTPPKHFRLSDPLCLLRFTTLATAPIFYFLQQYWFLQTIANFAASEHQNFNYSGA